MKRFHCSGCGTLVFFQNSQCITCGRKLGFLPDSLTTEALEPAGSDLWSRVGDSPGSRRSYRACRNGRVHAVCNWMVPAGEPGDFCVSCHLNDIIPDLSVPGNLERWRRLELAKRRCLQTLLALGLRFNSAPAGGGPALRFRFLGPTPSDPAPLTGHLDGVITVNIAEADDDERERRRVLFREPHRTLVGHLRHELGHYYWDRLIAHSSMLPRFRELFGDETVDYRSALETHYRQGPAPDWQVRSLTAYGCVHPWEDWAETWAHYLHIRDTLETADNLGLTLGTDSMARPSSRAELGGLLDRWVPLSCAINSINRGMGLPDLYPFVIPEASLQKLQFIHELINDESRCACPKPAPAAPVAVGAG